MTKAKLFILTTLLGGATTFATASLATTKAPGANCLPYSSGYAWAGSIEAVTNGLFTCPLIETASDPIESITYTQAFFAEAAGGSHLVNQCARPSYNKDFVQCTGFLTSSSGSVTFSGSNTKWGPGNTNSLWFGTLLVYAINGSTFTGYVAD